MHQEARNVKTSIEKVEEERKIHFSKSKIKFSEKESLEQP